MCSISLSYIIKLTVVDHLRNKVLILKLIEILIIPNTELW